MEYRTVKTETYRDSYFFSLTANEKLLFLYLFTSDAINNIGILPYTPEIYSVETKIEKEELLLIIEKFKNDEKIVIDEGELLVVNFIKNQTKQGASLDDKFAVQRRNLFKSTKSEQIKTVLFQKYTALFSMCELDDAEDDAEVLKDAFSKLKSKKIKEAMMSSFPSIFKLGEVSEDSEYYNFAQKLRPDATKKEIQADAKAIRDCIEFENISWPELKKIILWAKEDIFWKTNINNLSTLTKITKNGERKIKTIIAQYYQKNKEGSMNAAQKLPTEMKMLEILGMN